MPITTNTYNNIIWGSEYFPNNTYNVPDNLNTDRSFDTHNHDQSFIKSMVKFNDQSFILIGKFKYVYLTDNNIKYRLEVNGIVKFNSLGKIDEDFLKFTGNSLTANGNGFNSKSFQTVLTHNEVLFINTQLSPREILASVNDILLKNNNLYICGGFSTYRGVGISNNLTDDQAYNTSSLFKGRNSLVKISPINGDLDINTRFIFDSNDGLDDFVYNSNNYGYIDNRCSINTIVDYDADNILVGGSFTNIKLYKNSIEVDSKKSSIMKFKSEVLKRK